MDVAVTASGVCSFLAFFRGGFGHAFCFYALLFAARAGCCCSSTVNGWTAAEPSQFGFNVDLCVQATPFTGPLRALWQQCVGYSPAKTAACLLVSYRPLAHKNALLLVKLVSRDFHQHRSGRPFHASGQPPRTCINTSIDRACRIYPARQAVISSVQAII